MKQIILLLILIIIPFSAGAAVPPYTFFCEDNGYKVENEQCIFNKTESCDVYEFYNEECGIEFQTAPESWDCKAEGEFHFGYGDKCCAGLKPFLRPQAAGQQICVKHNIFQKFWWWLVDIFI